MDDVLLRQVLRQLRIINFFIISLAIFMLVGFLVLGILIYKVVTFTHNATDKISDLQQKTSQTLDVQNRICNTKSVGTLLQNKTKVCN